MMSNSKQCPLSHQKQMFSKYSQCLASIDKLCDSSINKLCDSSKVKRNEFRLYERIKPCKQANDINSNKPEKHKSTLGKVEQIKRAPVDSAQKKCKSKEPPRHERMKTVSLPGGGKFFPQRLTKVTNEKSPGYMEAKAKDEMIRQRDEAQVFRGKDGCVIRLDKLRAKQQNESIIFPRDDGLYPFHCVGVTCSGKPIPATHDGSTYQRHFHRKSSPPRRRLRPTQSYLIERDRWRRKREEEEAKLWTDTRSEEATGGHNDRYPSREDYPCERATNRIHPNDNTADATDADTSPGPSRLNKEWIDPACRRRLNTSHWTIQHLASQNDKFLKAERKYEDFLAGHSRRSLPVNQVSHPSFQRNTHRPPPVNQVSQPSFERNTHRPQRRMFPQYIPRDPNSLPGPGTDDLKRYSQFVGPLNWKHPITTSSNRRIPERRHKD